MCRVGGGTNYAELALYDRGYRTHSICFIMRNSQSVYLLQPHLVRRTAPHTPMRSMFKVTSIQSSVCQNGGGVAVLSSSHASSILPPLTCEPFTGLSCLFERALGLSQLICGNLDSTGGKKTCCTSYWTQ